MDKELSSQQLQEYMRQILERRHFMNKTCILAMLLMCILMVTLSACVGEPNVTAEEFTEPRNVAGQEKIASAEKQDPIYFTEAQTKSSTEKAQNKITLFDVEAKYGGDVRLIYPNFDELSVGVIYDSNDDSFYIFFDSEGVVHRITEDYIRSGFYEGMCIHNPKYMMDETGRLFRPQFLQDDEKIIRYAKDDFGVVFWTAKKVDSLEGSKVILTVWSSSGEMIAQFDSSQEEFEECSATSLYCNITDLNNRDGLEYVGGYIYRTKGALSDYYFLNIATKSVHYMRHNSTYPIVYPNGSFIFSDAHLLDNEWNILLGWENMVHTGPGNPVLSEGLIYLDGYINEVGGIKYPSGFYDPNLYCVIDLSQYKVQSISRSNISPRFVNGYAVLQLSNSDNVSFWGVMNRKGEWTFEPQKGYVNSFVPFKDGLLINVTSEKESNDFQTFTEDGKSLGESWHGLSLNLNYENIINGSYYLPWKYDTDDIFLYLSVTDYENNYFNHIIKVKEDGSYIRLS